MFIGIYWEEGDEKAKTIVQHRNNMPQGIQSE